MELHSSNIFHSSHLLTVQLLFRQLSEARRALSPRAVPLIPVGQDYLLLPLPLTCILEETSQLGPSPEHTLTFLKVPS